MERKHLYQLSSYDFIHPSDKKAANAIEKIPGFEKLTSFIQEKSIEKLYGIQLKGSAIRLTDMNSPKIMNIFKTVADLLEVQKFPDIYIYRNYLYEHRIVGYANPIVMLATSCIEHLPEDRIYFIVGRCMGAIKAGHNKLEFFSDVISQIGNMIPIPGTDALQIPLLQWRRKADLSRDRAGLLACQNYEEAMRMLMLYAGVDRNTENTIKIEDFMQQAVDFRNSSGGIEHAGKYLMTLFQSSSWVIERAAELFNWYETGEYDQVMIQHS
jgi:hypothetical protein